MAKPSLPPHEVLMEFLRALDRNAREWQEGLLPVLRGSLLLQHWYGERARPAADIDIECFIRPDLVLAYDPTDPGFALQEDYYGPVAGRYGRHGEYVSPHDLAKAMCRYAAAGVEYRRPGGSVGLRFVPVEQPPADGASLWVYGTPGHRYYAGWEWSGHRPSSGQFQIDLSTPGPYTPEGLGVYEERFLAPGNSPFQASVYSREAMLATKVSWLMRSFTRTDTGAIAWHGEPKDLFDAHLLAGDESLRQDLFQNAFLAIGTGDQLNWNSIDILFAIRRMAIDDRSFGNWHQFEQQYPNLLSTGPAELWAALMDRLEPLLAGWYIAEELPFWVAANAQPEEELNLLVYADWLDDRNDARGPLLRLIARALFPQEELTDRQEMIEQLQTVSQPWLHQLFGTSGRLQAFRDTLEGK